MRRLTLRRWMVLIAAGAVVLSTAHVHHRSPHGEASFPRFRWVDVGFSGTPFYFRASENSYDWRYFVFLRGWGWGISYINDVAGKRIVFGEATDPYDLVPTIWVKKKFR